MRIFSKFRDYYDGALGVFSDPSVVYDRKTRIESVVRTQEIPNKNDIFVQFNSPILAVGYDGSRYRLHSKNYPYTVIVNPQLTAIPVSELVRCGIDNKLQNIEEDIRLVTQLDPFTAMQELEMFIGNVLTSNTTPSMPVGTDDQIRDSKGFDKWSFRKMKEAK